MHVPFVPRLNEDIVQSVSLFGSWVLTCSFVPIWELEQSVGNSQVMFFTETEMQLYPLTLQLPITW